MTDSCSQPINPIKEEKYALIGCLRTLQKGYKLSLGFHADFIKAQFFPYIDNKLSRWDGDIREAVNLWCSDPAAAEKKYGHISQWDVSRVTNMNSLFSYQESFNEDISKDLDSDNENQPSKIINDDLKPEKKPLPDGFRPQRTPFESITDLVKSVFGNSKKIK